MVKAFLYTIVILNLRNTKLTECYGVIDRARESRNPKKVIRVTLMESYGEIGRVPVNLYIINQHPKQPYLYLEHQPLLIHL